MASSLLLHSKRCWNGTFLEQFSKAPLKNNALHSVSQFPASQLFPSRLPGLHLFTRKSYPCNATFSSDYGVEENGETDNLLSRKSRVLLPSKDASGELNPYHEHHGESTNSGLFHPNHEEYEAAAITLPPSTFGTYTGKSGVEKKYRFHIANGGQISASVLKEGLNYTVKVHVAMPEKFKKEELELHLHWGIFRTNKTNWFLLNPTSAPPGTYILEEMEAMRTPLIRDFYGDYFLSINFEAKYVPFALNFVLYQPKAGNKDEKWFRNTKDSNFCVPVGMEQGFAEPLGVVRLKDDAANFAIFSRNAEGVSLCLFNDETDTPAIEVDLDPSVHRTGNVWHVIIYNASNYNKYGYRCKGDITWDNGHRFNDKNILLDPYATFLTHYTLEKKGYATKYLGVLCQESFPFSWENDYQLCIPMEELIMYKLNVSKFSICNTSKLSNEIRGTFKAVAEKVGHLCNLGINAVVLEPIFAFDESQGQYFPISFFSPSPLYGSNKDSISSIYDLKYMVKELHKKGIEVILEVVFSHTAEKSDEHPKNISYRGIDNSVYYINDAYGKQIKSEFGTENVFNCNHPTVQKMIVDCLRYWVQEFHIDGFSFINSSVLVKGCHNQILSRSLLVEALTFDPILSRTKLIADFTSPINSISTNIQFPHWGRWMEMNHQFKNGLRKFIKGESSQMSNLATRIYGSADIFEKGRSPSHGINYISNNFDFNVSDLVSFSKNEEFSWNYGEDGSSTNQIVNDTRKRQIKNFIASIFLAQGIPLLTNGIEYLKFNANNNLNVSTFIDNVFDWRELEANSSTEMINFIRTLILFRRKNHTLLQRSQFLQPNQISWHGYQALGPAWDDPECALLGFSLYNSEDVNDGSFKQPLEFIREIYVAFNAHSYSVNVEFPSPPQNSIWHRVMDTGLPYPQDITLNSIPLFFETGLSYTLQPYSVLVAESKSINVLEG